MIDNTYSRLVGFLKIVLPLAALGVLSTLFLISRNIDTNSAIPYAEVDVRELAREERVGEPNFSSVTADGSAIRLYARSARPDIDTPDRLLMDAPQARIQTESGMDVDITAGSASMDARAELATLTDAVRVTTSTGYEVLTEGVVASLGETRGETDGAATANGPLGKIEAGRITLTEAEDSPGDYVLVFNEGVKLVYQP